MVAKKPEVDQEDSIPDPGGLRAATLATPLIWVSFFLAVSGVWTASYTAQHRRNVSDVTLEMKDFGFLRAVAPPYRARISPPTHHPLAPHPVTPPTHPFPDSGACRSAAGWGGGVSPPPPTPPTPSPHNPLMH